MPRYFLQGTFWLNLIPLCAISGLLAIGLILGALGLIWALKYAVLLFEARVRGNSHAPTLTTEAVMPTGDLRIWKLLGIILLLAYPAHYLYQLAPLLGLVVIAAILPLLPPITAQVTLEHSFPSLSRIIDYTRLLGSRRMAINMLFILLTVAVATLSIYVTLGYNAASNTEFAAALALVITINITATWLLFDGMGGQLHAAATSHDITLLHDPATERTVEAQQRAHAAFMTTLHTAIHTGRFADALTALRDLSADDSQRRETLDELLSWEPPRLGLVWGVEEIDRLAVSGREHLALDLLQRLHAVEPRIRPASDTATLLLAREVLHDPLPELLQLVIPILEQFAECFPESPLLPEAQLTLVKLLSADPERRNEALTIYNHLRERYPQLADTEQWQQLEETLTSN